MMVVVCEAPVCGFLCGMCSTDGHELILLFTGTHTTFAGSDPVSMCDRQWAVSVGCKFAVASVVCVALLECGQLLLATGDALRALSGS